MGSTSSEIERGLLAGTPGDRERHTDTQMLTDTGRMGRLTFLVWRIEKWGKNGGALMTF